MEAPAAKSCGKGVDGASRLPYMPLHSNGDGLLAGLRFAPLKVGITDARNLKDRGLRRVGSLTSSVKMKGHVGGGPVSWNLWVQGDR
jgi:hypothetical protein